VKANKTTVTYLSIYEGIWEFISVVAGRKSGNSYTRTQKKEEKHSPQHAIQPLQPSPQPTLSKMNMYILFIGTKTAH
jgi:hypothetical protein